MTLIDLGGKRALVTGGDRGIGAAVSRALAAAGASVAIGYHTAREQAEDLVAELGLAQSRKAYVVQADVGDEDSIGRMFRTVDDRSGGLDILINNAGVESTMPAIDMPSDEWDRVLDVNLRGAFLCSQQAARMMRQQGTGGVIVNNSSIHDTVPRLGLVHYAVSKAGLTMLTRSLGLEFADFGVRVVGVAPGVVQTEMNAQELDAFGRERFEGWIPAGRIGRPSDVAELVIFLVSEQGSYITGTTVVVDGGYGINVIGYDPRSGST